MRKLRLLALVSGGLLSCTGSGNKQQTSFQLTQDSLTTILNQISDTTAFNGFGVAVVGGKGILYQSGFGYANIASRQKYTDSTLQNIASISKIVIGIAVLKAQELGKLQLDDEVNRYLPFSVSNPLHPAVPITIRQLVTHTSSIADAGAYLHRAWVLTDTVNLKKNLQLDIGECKFSAPETEIGLEEFMQNVLAPGGKWYSMDNFLPSKPGAHFSYSNMGATLAALLVEKATGITYDQFTRQYIFEPLQMKATGWDIRIAGGPLQTRLYMNKTDPYPFYKMITYPDGGLVTSTADFSRFMQELWNGYAGRGTLLSRESYKEYFRGQLNDTHFTKRKDGEYSDEYNMGITMGISSTGNFGHTGGDPGLFSMLFFNPQTKAGRYLIVNTDMNDPAAWQQHYKIWQLLDSFAVKLSERKQD